MEAFLPLVFCPDFAPIEFPVLVFPFSLFGGDFPGLVLTIGHNSMELKKKCLNASCFMFFKGTTLLFSLFSYWSTFQTLTVLPLRATTAPNFVFSFSSSHGGNGLIYFDMAVLLTAFIYHL